MTGLEVLLSLFGRELARYAARRAVRQVTRNLRWLALAALLLIGWYLLNRYGVHLLWSTYRPSLPQLWALR